ncbi:hypothetical protein ABTC77_19190, partial [Acinetobacter baumannii]
DVAHKSLIGGRSNQEDIAYYDGDRHLLIADGMGGHVAGEKASRLAYDTAVSASSGALAPVPPTTCSQTEAADYLQLLADLANAAILS